MNLGLHEAGLFAACTQRALPKKLALLQFQHANSSPHQPCPSCGHLSRTTSPKLVNKGQKYSTIKAAYMDWVRWKNRGSHFRADWSCVPNVILYTMRLHYVLNRLLYEFYTVILSCSSLKAPPPPLSKESCDRWVHEVSSVPHFIIFGEMSASSGHLKCTCSF